jgi:hypothetical protein
LVNRTCSCVVFIWRPQFKPLVVFPHSAPYFLRYQKWQRIKEDDTPRFYGNMGEPEIPEEYESKWVSEKTRNFFFSTGTTTPSTLRQLHLRLSTHHRPSHPNPQSSFAFCKHLLRVSFSFPYPIPLSVPRTTIHYTLETSQLRWRFTQPPLVH